MVIGTEQNNNAVGVTRLTLTNFRCYESMRIEAGMRPIVLVGENGAGKTNILEALSLLVPGKGLRNARLGDMLRHKPEGEAAAPLFEQAPQNVWAVAAKVEGESGVDDVGTSCVLEKTDKGLTGRRTVKINGDISKSQSELGDILTAVWLVPAMDRLFQGDSSSRRRFLDRLIYAFDPKHARRTALYMNAHKQRKKLLDEGRADTKWIDALENNLVEHGIAIAAARRECVARLNSVIAEESSDAFPKAELSIEGKVENFLDRMPALDAEEKFRTLLFDARYDIYNVGSFEGPHRTDLTAVHNEKQMPAQLCSTGEQKAVLISIVLAHARAQANNKGILPILLLDEITAHLDDVRRHSLFEEICTLGSQVWMTGTDAYLFDELKNKADFYNIKNAGVEKV